MWPSPGWGHRLEQDRHAPCSQESPHLGQELGGHEISVCPSCDRQMLWREARGGEAGSQRGDGASAGPQQCAAKPGRRVAVTPQQKSQVQSSAVCPQPPPICPGRPPAPVCRDLFKMPGTQTTEEDGLRIWGTLNRFGHIQVFPDTLEKEEVCAELLPFSRYQQHPPLCSEAASWPSHVLLIMEVPQEVIFLFSNEGCFA